MTKQNKTNSKLNGVVSFYWKSILVIIIAFSFGATWKYLQTFMDSSPSAAGIVSGVVVFFMANIAWIAFNKIK